MAKSPAAILYDANGVAMAVADGVALPANTRGLIGVGYDGANVRFIRVDANGHQYFLSNQLPATLGQKAMAASLAVVLASDQSAIPVSQSGTWTVQQGTPPWAVKGTDADGAATTENPVLAAGYDGANVRTLEQRSAHPVAGDYGLVVRGIERTVPTFYAVIDRVTMAMDKYLATLFNTSATRKAVLQRLWVYNWQFANVAGGNTELELLRITARTAGTLVTPRAEDTADTLSAGITADTGSTAVTEAHLIQRIFGSGDEANFSQADLKSYLALSAFALRYERRRGQRGVTLRQNEGVSVKFVGGDDDGTASVVFEFTDEVA